MRKILLSIAFAGLLAGGTAYAQPPSPAGPQINVFISPMGEPFRRSQAPGEPIDRWFQGVDTDTDGALSVTEFQADAVRFYGLLDVNHNGEIAPDEITRYETEIAPEVQSGIGMTVFGRNNQRRQRSGQGPYGMGTQALLAIPQPVISADADLNRGVSPAEFRHTAGQRFLLIDRNHDGRITRDELGPPPEEDRRRR